MFSYCWHLLSVKTCQIYSNVLMFVDSHFFCQWLSSGRFPVGLELRVRLPESWPWRDYRNASWGYELYGGQQRWMCFLPVLWLFDTVVSAVVSRTLWCKLWYSNRQIGANRGKSEADSLADEMAGATEVGQALASAPAGTLVFECAHLQDRPYSHLPSPQNGLFELGVNGSFMFQIVPVQGFEQMMHFHAVEWNLL